MEFRQLPNGFFYPPPSEICAGNLWGNDRPTASCHAQTCTKWSDSVKQSPGPSCRYHSDHGAVLTHHPGVVIVL